MDKEFKYIQKTYGEDALVSLRDMLEARENLKHLSVFSMGSAILNWKVLGIGGAPRGRVIEVAGKEGGGKTTVCLHAAISAQKEDQLVAYIDAENKLDPYYAQAVGLDLDRVFISQPATGEEGLDIADALCKVPDMGLIIYDSAAALGSNRECEKNFQDNADVAKMPRLLNKFFRRNLSIIRENNISVIFTNQIRDVIGSFIPMKNTPGGHGLQFYSSILLRLTRIKDIKVKGDVVGQVVKAHTVKNNVARPRQVGQFSILYGIGIDYELDLIEYAVTKGPVKKRGSFYVYEGNTIAQGALNAAQELKDNPELKEQIERDIKK